MDDWGDDDWDDEEADEPPCTFEGGCANPILAKKLKLCRGHYNQHRKGWKLQPLRQAYDGPCVGCGSKKTWSRKLCSACYMREYRAGGDAVALPSPTKAWSRKEIEVAMRVELSNAEVAKLLVGRTTAAVEAERKRLGIKAKKPQPYKGPCVKKCGREAWMKGMCCACYTRDRRAKKKAESVDGG